MAIRSKEFVGIAEGIKSHELSTKARIESLQGTISELYGAKRSLDSQISYLEAALAAAYEDTDEDGEPDYGRISAIEAQISQAENELSEVEGQLDTANGELSQSQAELERVMEEKAQTLFEIQERARKTSNNIAVAGGMYGAYSGVGNSLQSSMQTNLASLSQAASILDGSVDGFTGGGSGGGDGGGSTGGRGMSSQGELSTSALSAFVGGYSSTEYSGNTSQASTPSSFASNHVGGATPATTSGFRSAQQSINPQKTLNFNSEQSGNSYAVSAFSNNENDKSTIQPSQYSSSQTSPNMGAQLIPSSEGLADPDIFSPSGKRTISGVAQRGWESFTQNAPRAIDSFRVLKKDGAVADGIYKFGETIGSRDPTENKILAKKIEYEATEKSPASHESLSKKLKNEYPSSIGQKIANARSISELASIIMTEQLARNCYLGDLELPTAKALVQTIYSSIKESGLQDIIGTMPVIGTISDVYGKIRKRLEVEFQRLYRERYPDKPISDFNEDIQYQVEDYMATKLGIPDDTLAISVSFDAQKDFDVSKEKILQGGYVTAAVGDNIVSKSFNGFLLNVTDNTSLKKLKEKLVQEEADGHSPKGCNTFQYLVIHELVHQADHILKISSDSEVIKYFNKFSDCDVDRQKELLCLYGAENIYEFVAEAYAEAICSAHPRKIALYIKQKFDAAATDYRKKSNDYLRERER